MKKINKSLIISFGLILVLLIIQYIGILDKITSPMYDDFSRNKTLGISNRELTPIFNKIDDEKFSVIYNSEDGLSINIMDYKGQVIKDNIIEDENLKDRKNIINQQVIGDKLIWQEKSTLYIAEINYDTYEISNVIQKIEDVYVFDTVDTEDYKVLAIASGSDLIVYDLSNFNVITSIKKDYKIKKISLSKDTNNSIYASYGVKVNSYLDEIYISKINLLNKDIIENKILEKVYPKNYALYEFELVAEQNELYLFMNIQKTDGKSQQTRGTYIFIQDFNNIESIEEENMPVLGSYITEYKPIYYNNKVNLYVQRNSNFIELNFDEGKYIDKRVITKTKKTSENISIYKIENKLILLWLDVSGFDRYTVNMASNNQEIIRNFSKNTLTDYIESISQLFFSIVYVFVLGTFTLFSQTGAFIYFIIISFFERKIEKKYLLFFGIGIIIYLAMKIYSFDAYYKNPQMLPDILTFNGAHFIIPIITSIISLIPIMVFWKNKKSTSQLFVFAYFAIFDIIFTALIYSPFISNL